MRLAPPRRELRDYVENIRNRLILVPDVSKIEILGAQDEQIIIEFSTEKLAGLGIDRATLIAALQAQNAVNRPARSKPGTSGYCCGSQVEGRRIAPPCVYRGYFGGMISPFCPLWRASSFAPNRSAAARNGVSAICAYRLVVVGLVWPRRRPTISRLRPLETR
jgi:hypothetical protein